MASFSETSFDAAGYSSSRPSYPPAFYSYIANCTRPTEPSSSSLPRVCVDLGCGPGLSTVGFLSSEFNFDQIIGIEPGQGMVKVANSLLEQQPEEVKKRIKFEQGTAEDLSLIIPENESVDLVVACTSAHWFKDQLRVYKEISRILKPGGSFFFFTYSIPHFPTKPEFESLLPEFNYQTLGPYWSEPGHKISETLLAQYPLPYFSNFPNHPEITREFDPESFSRSFFLVSKESKLPELIETEVREEKGLKIERFDNDEERMLRRKWDLEKVKNLLATWSAAHTWNEKHPGRDCASEFAEKLKKAGWKDGEEYEVVWEIGSLYGRKK
ncbi:hypothetical protein JCM5350_003052 [Sporobolomyces pararoseus]